MLGENKGYFRQLRGLRFELLSGCRFGLCQYDHKAGYRGAYHTAWQLGFSECNAKYGEEC